MSDGQAWRATFHTRLFALAVFVVGWMGLIEARLLYLQVIDHQALHEQAERQQQSHTTVTAPRGTIVDRHGTVLARNVRGAALEAQRNRIADPEATAARLCAALDRCSPADRSEMARDLRWTGKGAKYVYLRRRLSAEEAERITALKEDAVAVVPVPLRVYPGREVAAHLVGYVNVDGLGKIGLEYAFNDVLAGRNGRALLQRSELKGQKILSTRLIEEPRPGASLETTIDRELQYIAERDLAAAVREANAAGGSVIVMDPFTGDILAMANAPTFDPNEPGLYDPEVRQNRAAQHIYEPGSTFKSFIAAAALESLRMSPEQLFDVSAGYIQFGARRIRDDHRYRTLTFTDVIVKSSNVGAIKIGLQLGPEVVSRYVSRFGFGEVLTRDVPHQRLGLVDRNMSKFGPSALASVSMGYQIGVTPLQMATAVASIANGGELVAPRVVRAVVAPNGVRTERPRRVVRRTIPAEVAGELTAMLEQVVERGTATRARIEGYTIAGKTGTAKKLVNGRYANEYNASFVGFVPSRKPRAVVLAVIDTPRRNGYYGGLVAAPLFRSVAEATLRRLGVPPNVDPPAPVLVARRGGEPVPVPASVGPTALRPRPVPLAPQAGVVPDVRGLSAREALGLLARSGVAVRLNGSGFVARQSLAPGTRVEPGRPCVLSLTREPVVVTEETGTPQ
jgi:cell division protein FtsI (penicillin-binding protein 3)